MEVNQLRGFKLLLTCDGEISAYTITIEENIESTVTNALMANYCAKNSTNVKEYKLTGIDCTVGSKVTLLSWRNFKLFTHQ